MGLRYAFNTNGCAHHRLDDALALIADCGYDGVALTLDHHHHDPFADDRAGADRRLADRLDELGLGAVIETGARYLLDPSRKHHPTLVADEPEGRARRVDFLRRAVDVGAAVSAEAVSCWAGVPGPGVEPELAWRRLVDGIVAVAAHAAERGVPLAVEPEPGHVVETVDDWVRLADAVRRRTDAPIAMALDTGHCWVTGDREPSAAVREFAGRAATVAVEDMPRGVHDHRAIGEGDMDVAAVVEALVEVGWSRLVTVELSRDSHRAHEIVPATIEALRQMEPTR